MRVFISKLLYFSKFCVYEPVVRPEESKMALLTTIAVCLLRVRIYVYIQEANVEMVISLYPNIKDGSLEPKLANVFGLAKFGICVGNSDSEYT